MSMKGISAKPKSPSAPVKSVAEGLAAKLRRSITDRKFAVGGSLPSERDLMEHFGVSRTSVREALRMLSAQGLIEVRRGRTGGSYISNPRPELMVQSLNTFIKGQNLRFRDLVFAREAIEPAAAAQAALCRTDEQLADLRRQCENCAAAVNNMAAFVDANMKWHFAVLTASNNPLFFTFLSSISAAMQTATDREEFDLKTRKDVVEIHWRIYEAIAAREPEAARRKMALHLEAYREELTALELEKVKH